MQIHAKIYWTYDNNETTNKQRKHKMKTSKTAIKKVIGTVATVIINVTDYDIDCILSSCFEGGSNYWLDNVTVQDFKGQDYASKVVGSGGTILLHYDGEKAELTLEMMIKGLYLYYSKYKKPEAIEDMDAGDYDSILQYALFGELVYG